MIKITFLKKDETAKKIYRTIWKNRNLRYVPFKPPCPFHGFYEDKENELFIFEGKLYVTYGMEIMINKPEHPPVFTDDEIYSTVAIEKVDFQRQKGQGRFLTEENLDKRFELLEVGYPFDENGEMNPLVKLMAMHKTIMEEIEKHNNSHNGECL